MLVKKDTNNISNEYDPPRYVWLIQHDYGYKQREDSPNSILCSQKVVCNNTFKYGVDIFICMRENLTNSIKLCSHYGFV